MRNEPDYVSFECSYIQGPDELTGPDECTAAACAAIDGYPADPDESGTVICNVWMLHDGSFLIDWHHNGYRGDVSVLDLIEQAKQDMQDHVNLPERKHSLLIFAKAEFADGTATIAKYHGMHDHVTGAKTIDDLLGAVRKYYEGIGRQVTSVTAVDENAYDLYAASHDDDAVTLTWENTEGGSNIDLTASLPAERGIDPIIREIRGLTRAGKAVDPRITAAIDMYGLSSNKLLFESMFARLMGEPMAKWLADRLEQKEA